MVIAEVSIIAVGTSSTSASEYVARAIKVLKQQKDIKYQLTAMGTVLEGKLEDVMNAVKRMHEAVFANDVKRVVTSIKIDDRRDKDLTIDYKVQSVTEKIG